MFGSNVLEVAIGVIFVYLVLSLISSVINEQLFTRLMALRATTLEDGIKTMLDDKLAQQFYNHDLIQGLSRQGKFDKILRRVSQPSYISAEIFALALREIITSYKYALNPGALPSSLQTLLKQAQGDADQELVILEKWFNDTMERVSGWYKRKVQLILFVLGLLIAIGLNIDTISLVNNLANNSTLRSTIVAAAQGTDKSVLDPGTNISALEKNFQAIQPTMGWTANDVPHLPQDAYKVLLKILGLLATAFAISLGAPFWFDLLDKLVSLRATGKPPDVAPASKPASRPAPTATPRPASAAQAAVVAQPAVTNTPLVTTDHYLGLKDGVFDTTTRADLNQLFTSLKASLDTKLVIHFHGGLVDLAAGKAHAQSILSYANSKEIQAYQVFFIWESGFLDTLTNILAQDLQAISGQPAFKSLLSTFDPFIQNPGSGQPLQGNQRAELQRALKKNVNFGDLGINLVQTVQVLERVTGRIANRRDHGVQATLIEEILRQINLDMPGAMIWQHMKQTASDAFSDDGSKYGGMAFLQNLRDYCASNKPPEITLIGHSAGSIYICYFLRKAVELLPDSIRFNIVLLAPACTFKFFDETLALCQDRIANMRIFGMQDMCEQKDVLVAAQPWLYPSSLLYFVSGVLEEEPDMPLLGMQRYYTDKATYMMPEVQNSLTYLNSAGAHPTVWSRANEGNGLASTSIAHGGFYNDNATLESIRYIVERGF